MRVCRDATHYRIEDQAELRCDRAWIGTGGWMSAYVLAKAGVKVLMLEAGRNYDPITQTFTLYSARGRHGPVASRGRNYQGFALGLA